jgi:Cu2+-exporting ATPase
VRRAQAEGPLAEARDFVADAGRGVEGVVEGTHVQVGGPGLLRSLKLEAPHEGTPIAGWEARGATVLFVVRDGEIVGALALEDEIRPESHEAVAALHAAGVRVAMVTGDAQSVASAVAEKLGIDEVFAEVLPEYKARKVSELQARGLRVAMVGDGVNDAPALAQADVGVAIGAGTDVAIESAGVVLAGDDPRGVLGIVRLSRAAYSKMVQNLFWATGYNVVAIPVAAGALAGWGVVLPPALAAVFMSLSTIAVAANAQLLRRLPLHLAEVE